MKNDKKQSLDYEYISSIIDNLVFVNKKIFNFIKMIANEIVSIFNEIDDLKNNNMKNKQTLLLICKSLEDFLDVEYGEQNE